MVGAGDRGRRRERVARLFSEVAEEPGYEPHAWASGPDPGPRKGAPRSICRAFSPRLDSGLQVARQESLAGSLRREMAAILRASVIVG